MRTEMKTIYIAEDGKEFDTLEKCQSYESSCIETLECKLVELISKRNYDLSLKNRYKANKHGKLAKTEAKLQYEYMCIKKMIRVPVEKMSLNEVELLEKSVNTVKLCLLQRKQQKEVLETTRSLIKERGELIRSLYEKIVKLKLEKLNS
jgi:type IV secretory pathway VirB4 component